jgi:hypothetical protein
VEEYLSAMSSNFIKDLIDAVERVFPPDKTALEEVLIISGMPESTQNLRYLGFNRQVVQEDDTRKAFSAVAVVNNRRAELWRLKGYFQKASQIIFHPRWTRNELDLFINALRCSPDIMHLLASTGSAYSLLGILEMEDRGDSGIFRRWSRRIRPVLAVPGLTDERIRTVAAFERLNEIRKTSRGPRTL